MPTTTSAVLLDGPTGPPWVGPPPSGGNFLPLVHYGGLALFAVSLLAFVAICGWMVWSRVKHSALNGAGLALTAAMLGATNGAIAAMV